MYTKNVIYLVFSVCLLACTSNSSQNSNRELCIFDISSDYPLKEVDIHEIADVEYIALETTENSLLKNTIPLKISDKYIVVNGIYDGKIFFFDRSGKHLWTNKHIGQGNKECLMIGYFEVDFANEEYFIYDIQKLQVYSLKGEYKRMLPLKFPRSEYCKYLINYDEKYLFAYHELMPRLPGFEKPRYPFFLIDKQTGAQTPIDLKVERPLQLELWRDGEKQDSYPKSVLNNAGDILIAEGGLDTLYSYTNDKITPIAVRTPSVYEGPYPLAINAVMYSDKYFIFEVHPIYWNARECRRGVLDRETGEVRKWKLYDSNISSRGSHVLASYSLTATSKNLCMFVLSPEDLLEQLEAGELKGPLKEVASKLKFDDNKVIAICKLK